MAASWAEGHADIGQFVPSLLDEDDTDIDASYRRYSIATIYRTSFHIEHRRSCPVNLLAVDLPVAKLESWLKKVTRHSTLDGAYTMAYQKASASRRRNCPACGMIIETMRFFWQPSKFNKDSFSWRVHDGLVITRHPASNDHLEFLTKYGDQSLSLSINRKPFVGPKSRQQHLRIRNTLVGNFSEEAICWAKEWIDRCNQEHTTCSATNKAARLPTRVLDLETGLPHNGIKLADTKGISSRYVCLSHCWGKSRNKHLTTMANLKANRASIPLDQLPRTMQDAITVTRKFGIRYLWIDSLCIVQDSIEDWSHEAAQMASTYENSFFTIGATSAGSDDDGFLSRFDTHLKLQVKTREGTLQELYVQRVALPEDMLPESQPLLRRAWCYQERLLSSRMLHFTKRELWWECRNKHDCVCGNISNHYGTRMMLLEKPRLYEYMAHPRIWRQIVETYSDLNMTLEKDKLPALSGLAQRVQNLRKDDYLAGLWSQTLVDDLCWRASSCEGRPREWRAPSWSWAAVNGHITWDETSLSPQGIFINDGTYAADVDVIACETVQIGEDRTGGVQSGFLTIRGKLSPARIYFLEHKHEPSRSRRSNWLSRICKSDDQVILQDKGHARHKPCQVEIPTSSVLSATGRHFPFLPDTPIGCDLKSITGRLFKLRMFRNTDTQPTTIEIFGASRCFISYMIIRLVADGSGNYERIGWAKFWDSLVENVDFPELLDGETEVVITIV
ncbi:HET-domain-containing protein [Hyaloscypha bicolor E]|uniref:HET-domain-containing protein n=1 Tax=Hyaloscypha bicolor E TaxID=1095630 RepID=A0A2J6TVG9_9HELO|nr:HET-domain-containing protein [Hyaloscypha bicolor E]PMD66958.1 HET-domain-containing protein [Hyaloscypha bicolor E]